jgi:hypothetical protein
MIYVPSLHAELMSTTALTPTHHKGGIAKVVSIVAAIAIPMAAPGIASSIGLSTVLGSQALGSAVVGGVLGAGVAAATGGDPLMGGLGGAFGGFARGGGFSGISSALSSPVTAAPGMGLEGMGQALASPSAVIGMGSTAGLTTSGGGQFAVDDFAAGEAVDRAFTPTTPFNAVAGQQAGLGNTLSGGGIDPQVSASQNPFPVNRQFASFSGEGIPPMEGTSNSNFYPSMESAPTGQAGSLSNLEIALAGGDIGTDVGTAGIAAREAPGFFDTIGNKLTQGVKKAFNPDRLIEEGLQAGGKYALNQISDYMADDEVPMSPEETGLMDDRARARAEQERLLGRKEDLADTFLDQARTISPLQRGQQALALDQDRFNRANELYMRSINPRNTGALNLAKRQSALQKARLGSSFARGQQQGQTEQQQLVSRAAGVLPTGSGIANAATSDLTAADNRYRRLLESQKNAGQIFGGLVLPTGAKTEEERKKQIKNQYGVK